MKNFEILRKQGTGWIVVAEGTIFTSGQVAIQWKGESVTTYLALDHITSSLSDTEMIVELIREFRTGAPAVVKRAVISGFGAGTWVALQIKDA